MDFRERLRKLNAAKNQIDFTIEDAEMENEFGYPPGIEDMDFQQIANYSLKKGSARPLEGTIIGNFKMIRAFPVSYGWNRVLGMIRERVRVIRQNGIGVFIHGFRVQDNVMKRSVSFSVNFLLMPPARSKGKLDLENFVRNNGLFKTPVGISYAEWAGSMQNTAWHQRGLARLGASSSSDKLVDPCNQPGKMVVRDRYIAESTTGLGEGLSNAFPSRDQSYIYWENDVEVYSSVKQYIHSAMSRVSSGNPAVNSIFDAVGSVFGNVVGNQRLTPLIVQHENSALVYVVLKGKALRLGYYPEHSILKTAFGRTPVFVDNKSVDKWGVVANLGDIPVYRRRWQLVYLVPFKTPQEATRKLQETLNLAVVATPENPNGELHSL